MIPNAPTRPSLPHLAPNVGLEPTTLRLRVSCSKDVEVTADDTDSGVAFETMELRVDSETVDEAVATILENHHVYTRRAMMDILEDRFPELPPAARHLFVTVATSAARYVAGIEEIHRTAGAMRTERGTHTARKAAGSLMSWRHGFRRATTPQAAKSSTHVVVGRSEPLPELVLPPPPAFALQMSSILPDPSAAKADILLQSLREAGLPVLALPDPELEAQIDEELGQQPVVGDLSDGIPFVPPSQDDSDPPKNSVTDDTVPAPKYRPSKSFSSHSGQRHSSAPYDYRRPGRLSEDDVELYSPQPFMPRRPGFNCCDHQHRHFLVSHQRRRL